MPLLSSFDVSHRSRTAMTVPCRRAAGSRCLMMLLPASQVLLLIITISGVAGWTTSTTQAIRITTNRRASFSRIRTTTVLQVAEEEEDALLWQNEDDTEKDWRRFRAKLVLQDRETSTQDNRVNKDSTTTASWAYTEAGTLIEKGSIILSRVESILGCHDLRQPYFHKCAVLVLEHDEDSITKGIILNRPSDLVCSDGDILSLLEEEGKAEEEDLEEKAADRDSRDPKNPDGKNAWSMSFGGDIAGLFSEQTTIVMLHNISSPAAKACSNRILPNLYITSPDGAKSLVAAGVATCDDFYSFYGYALWEKGMLQREVDRGSWYIVSMDSGTVLETLNALRRDQNNPQEAGLSCWENWTILIHKTKEERVEESRNAFSDLMLKEWCREMLCIDEAEEDILANFNTLEATEDERTIGPGSLIRASNQTLAFMLFDQLFHKSTVLLLKEEEELSLGVILNLPTTEAYIHTLPNGTQATLPIRYGGPMGYEDGDSNILNKYFTMEEGSRIIWLHCNTQLRTLAIGKSISDIDPTATHSPIWTCSQIQALHAIDMGIAKPTDFLCVQGYAVWEKEMGMGGIEGELFSGSFQPVDMDLDCVRDVWSILQSQFQLKALPDVKATVLATRKAWEMRCEQADLVTRRATSPRVVHGTTVSLSDFADEALRTWIEIFLLDKRKYDPI